MTTHATLLVVINSLMTVTLHLFSDCSKPLQLITVMPSSCMLNALTKTVDLVDGYRETYLTLTGERSMIVDAIVLTYMITITLVNI